ncbi:uracil-DNA glycosylase [Cesiribacter andamanensis]|uniref:Uracil-DNA glycosylase n=1 Tax=Cesiribacter andamanensis AMV16 TaxID=1279009 RepID=M7N4A0_9BACT|nr:uracil-DNA glycosylase [Cesiribacter andamanensis]EMR02117.1 Uracil-DNA glycosylase [Cesiribacter andamanensis AMV16]
MDVKIASSWKDKLQNEFQKPYFRELTAFVRQEYKTHTVYPPGPLIFNAFAHCAFEGVKVVILGQDPYHNPGQANGLAFSVADGVATPPSLQNIYKEVSDEFGTPIPPTGNLERWADQGVLLLNATLTVRAHQPGSHQKKGWEEFTDAVIELLSREKKGLVFLLWGAYAQKKGAIIDESKHLVLKSAHPSPFAANRGFFGNKHFKKTNDYLAQQGLEPIVW